ncbi:hypothetical protein PMSD_05430 [Paenibacillus macquariensis subsp. defensor]|nr:hypothetical protein PMSD_05430 [Paenibacillus macquariensis subsp. defensor]
MTGKEIWTDADLQNCIYFQKKVEVWVAEDAVMDEIYKIVDFNDKTIRVSDGNSFLQSNITIRIT